MGRCNGMHDGGGGGMGLKGGGNEGDRCCTAAPAGGGGGAKRRCKLASVSVSDKQSHKGPTYVQQDDTKSSAAPLVRVTVNNRPEIKRPV